MDPWPNQTRGVADVLEAIRLGHKRICLTSPTGMGKTLMFAMLAREFLLQDRPVSWYANRRLLVEQTSAALDRYDMEHGVRAAGFETGAGRLFQLSSIQTEHSRVTKRKTAKLHASDLVLVDEAHLFKGQSALDIFVEHSIDDAVLVGATATPLSLGDIYQHLVIAGTKSEGRAYKALLPVRHYGIDEPSLRKLKVPEGEDPTPKEIVKAIMRNGIIGRVVESFNRLNPDRKPTILFGPDVAGSLWFAERLVEAGISAAHIDGTNVWVNGSFYRTNPEMRQEVLEGSRTGKITVLCNRFVLREGIDAPWLGHAIFATIFGSLQSYLQSGGRVMRYFPGLEHVTVQDHGGHWWRHPSLNADIAWDLRYTSAMLTGMRHDRFRKKTEREPFRCPKCALIMIRGTCVGCGFEAVRHIKSRPVVEQDGTLVEMHGDIFRQRSVCRKPKGPELWKKMYFRSRTDKAKGRSFRAAAALFAYENNWQWPDASWPLMPVAEEDWYRPVRDVPYDRLTGGPRPVDTRNDIPE